MSDNLLHKVDMDWLLGFYGALLTEKQLNISRLYYEEDYSLAEIAQMENVSRQSIHDTLQRVEKQLLDMEEKLGLCKRLNTAEKCIRDAQEILNETGPVNRSASKLLKKAISLLNDEEEEHGL